MKSTGELAVTGDYTLKREVLVIHPNDGYDLGLLARDNRVAFCSKVSSEDFQQGKGASMPGMLQLLNDCTQSTIRINLVWWQELGKPKRVRLSLEQNRLHIAGA